MISGYYSVIQYEPSNRPFERLNVGIFLIVPNGVYEPFVGAKLLKSFRRLQDYARERDFDVKCFRVMLTSVAHKLKRHVQEIGPVNFYRCKGRDIRANELNSEPPIWGGQISATPYCYVMLDSALFTLVRQESSRL